MDSLDGREGHGLSFHKGWRGLEHTSPIHAGRDASSEANRMFKKAASEAAASEKPRRTLGGTSRV